jgi:hypothetical protein
LTLADKPGFEPGNAIRETLEDSPSNFAARCLRKVEVVAADRNRYRPKPRDSPLAMLAI